MPMKGRSLTALAFCEQRMRVHSKDSCHTVSYVYHVTHNLGAGRITRHIAVARPADAVLTAARKLGKSIITKTSMA